MTVVDSFRQTVASNPDGPAVICHGIRMNYREVDSRVNRLAAGLSGLGIEPGDRIAILSLNCHRFFELYYGAPLAGAVVVPLNFRVQPRELKYVIDHSGSRAVVVDPVLGDLIDPIRAELDSVDYFLSLGDEPREGYILYEELLRDAPAEFSPPSRSEDDLVGLFYTSGTTGEPKGVMLSHANIVSNVENSNAIYERQQSDVYLHAAPMFHLADAATVYSVTANGSTHVFIPRFDPKAVLETISREGVTTILLVPTMINFILRQPDLESYDLSTLRQITYGASPIAPELLRKAMKVLNCRFFQGYGLTEASPLVTVLGPDDHVLEGPESRRLASCGKPAPGVEVRIIKDDGSEIRPGEVGEITARGRNVMAGYWQRPADTAATVREGWLYTGDLATIDEAGYIYLVDRKKDMIVTGGENVFSTEVEAALYEHPAVKEAAVIPIPDPDWGEAVHACVALADGRSITEAELIEFCRGRLANYKLPRSIEFVAGELPKGGTGKILKKELRERYWANSERKIG
jgi:long-chain acyl-CoA synthetase